MSQRQPALECLQSTILPGTVGGSCCAGVVLAGPMSKAFSVFDGA